MLNARDRDDDENRQAAAEIWRIAYGVYEAAMDLPCAFREAFARHHAAVVLGPDGVLEVVLELLKFAEAEEGSGSEG